MQAHTDHSRRVDDGVEDAIVAARHEVVMIECSRAARQRKLAEADERGRVHVIDVETAPHRIQLVSQPKRSQPTARPRVIHWKR